ncbi:uncharacterized protein LOC115617061 [Strigops habroptila]|uniref:uncharacterized protein LOC115617061 n=1 Tax=Strigops habroptila TaxID=2489341 RepID=UPI0011CF7F24|nr:uncharacterized protein LOC115617061 [Strigops habroptila]XP_030362974.1 uncharacterized protein LOC115617061 [Strigops habroptila]
MVLVRWQGWEAAGPGLAVPAEPRLPPVPSPAPSSPGTSLRARGAGCGRFPSHTNRARTPVAVASRIPPLPAAWELGTMAGSELGDSERAWQWARLRGFGGCISAGLGLTGALWGAGAPQVALEDRPERDTGGIMEKTRSSFLHCLTTLWWESSIRELQGGLSGSPTAFHGWVWSVVQGPGVVVSKPCSWQIFGETLPQAHHVMLQVLFMVPWVRAGCPKVPCECQRLYVPSSQDEDSPLLIPSILCILFLCSTHTCWKLSILQCWSIANPGCRALPELETLYPRRRSDATATACEGAQHRGAGS